MFARVLIANRGEIACRIIATCRRLGVRTVAVYSDADAGARHVRLADEAWCVGPPAARDSYLRIENILHVARESGAQAVHPGYGFLSENAAFADACAATGMVFIGPPASAIRAMGSKSAAKALMATAGVPLVPGYHGPGQDPDHLRREADAIGYPVLIKACAGGGGKGMRVVDNSADFEAALAACRREAAASFGDESVLLEKYVGRARHIEIQVFGDTRGNLIHLYERDCSAQRRHQKVIEEAPAPGMNAQCRAAMGRAACDAARAVGYVGAGTVEFLVDESGAFYFMEMNTRLQVEHPVTELITGLDLVEWQLRVAAGEPLPCTQEQVPLRGHAIEARIYAEEPERGFRPSTGALQHFVSPAASAQVRIDSGVEVGDEIGPYYDPMLAKLIVWDEARERAVERMLQALEGFQIVGVGNNLAFLSRLVGHAAFRTGRVDTGLIGREGDALLRPDDPPPAALEAAALWITSRDAREQRARATAAGDAHSPWGLADGWRVSGAAVRKFEFAVGQDNGLAGESPGGGRDRGGNTGGDNADGGGADGADAAGAEATRTLRLQYGTQGYLLDGRAAVVERADERSIRYRLDGRCHQAAVVAHAGTLHVFLEGRHSALTLIDPLTHAGEDRPAEGGLTAPMPGRIVALLAAEDAEVARGAPLLVMEAMKMEHTLCAPARGRVQAYRCQAGELVKEGAELIDFVAAT